MSKQRPYRKDDTRSGQQVGTHNGDLAKNEELHKEQNSEMAQNETICVLVYRQQSKISNRNRQIFNTDVETLLTLDNRTNETSTKFFFRVIEKRREEGNTDKGISQSLKKALLKQQNKFIIQVLDPHTGNASLSGQERDHRKNISSLGSSQYKE